MARSLLGRANDWNHIALVAPIHPEILDHQQKAGRADELRRVVRTDAVVDRRLAAPRRDEISRLERCPASVLKPAGTSKATDDQSLANGVEAPLAAEEDLAAGDGRRCDERFHSNSMAIRGIFCRSVRARSAFPTPRRCGNATAGNAVGHRCCGVKQLPYPFIIDECP